MLVSDTVCGIQLRCLHQRTVAWVLLHSALVSVETLVFFLVYRSYVTEDRATSSEHSAHFGSFVI